MSIKVQLLFYNTFFTFNFSILDLFIKEDLAIRRESAVVNIEGLSSLKSLHVALNSLEISFSIRNLPSLRVFYLSVHRIDENITHIFNQMQYIEELGLHANLNYFNLDHLVNLSKLIIGGDLCDDFNFELFKNLSKQLEQLTFFFYKIDYEIFFKMLNGHNFPNLLWIL